MNADFLQSFLIRLFKCIGKRWRRFIREVRRFSSENEVFEMKIDDFTGLLSKFRLKPPITIIEKELIEKMHSGRGNNMINISFLYQVKT